MGKAESGLVAAAIVSFVVQLGFAVALFVWGRWVARRHGTAGWRRAAWMPLLAFLLAVAGLAVSSALLVGAFGAVATVDAAHKVAVLARSISEAMNAAALLWFPSALLYGASLVAFTIGSLVRPRASG